MSWAWAKEGVVGKHERREGCELVKQGVWAWVRRQCLRRWAPLPHQPSPARPCQLSACWRVAFQHCLTPSPSTANFSWLTHQPHHPCPPHPCSSPHHRLPHCTPARLTPPHPTLLKPTQSCPTSAHPTPWLAPAPCSLNLPVHPQTPLAPTPSHLDHFDGPGLRRQPH